MEYGEFSSDGTEYIFHTPRTPRPWLNFLTNGRYAALTSPTGGGFSFVEDSGYNRLTRTHPGDFLLEEVPGRYLYIRDEDGAFWGLTGAPVPVEYEHWEARHGIGYTSVSARHRALAGEVTFFVPPNDSLEIWRVRLKNECAETRKISVFSYVELVLGNFQFDLLERSFADLFNETGVERGVLWATKRFWNVPHAYRRRHDRPAGGNPNLAWNKIAFMASTVEPQAFGTVRDDFIGRGGSLAKPAAVERGVLSGRLAQGESGVFSLQLDFTLAPGEEVAFAILFGATEHVGHAFDLLAKYRGPAEVDAALAETREHWIKSLSAVQVETPDREFDLATNIWTKFQTHVVSYWSRMASGYLGGSSILGFRDTCQDTYGLLPLNPHRAKERLHQLLQHQLHGGDTLHNWDPRTNLGPVTGHSDDPLWLVLLGVNYLKETGDWDILNEALPFYDEGSATVWDHLRLAIEHSLSQRRSPHEEGALGISRMGAADWNDGLDQVGIQGLGESTFTSFFLVWMLKEMAELAQRLGHGDLAERYQREAADLADKLNRNAWDGRWYIRGKTDAGEVFGSHRNRYGRIYLNPQSWAVLSGVADRDRALTALDAVREHLDTPYGPALLAPAYADPDPSLGIISRFSPGTKENGSIFNHPVAWLVIAETMLGRGEEAYDYFKKTSYLTRAADPDLYQTEPYVYAEYVEGPSSPGFGRGGFSWMTGTAAWMWRAAVDYILGVRPEYDGLRIDPCLPPTWREVKIKRRFRGVHFDIVIQNPHGLTKGRVHLWVDGKPQDEPIVEVPKESLSRRILAVLEDTLPTS